MSPVTCPEAASCILDFLQRFVWSTGRIARAGGVEPIGIIICVAMVHLAITNLAACIALLVPITMTIASAAGVNPIVCALAVTIVVDSVILYPVQTAANLIAYESGYYGAADVARLGFAMLGLTIAVSLCIAVPYWSALGLPLMAR